MWTEEDDKRWTKLATREYDSLTEAEMEELEIKNTSLYFLKRLMSIYQKRKGVRGSK